MIESDLDKIMEKESLLEIYWRILNEPIPSTYFRYAKSKVGNWWNEPHDINNEKGAHESSLLWFRKNCKILNISYTDRFKPIMSLLSYLPSKALFLFIFIHLCHTLQSYKTFLVLIKMCVQVMMFYSSLCEEGPQYSNKLTEKFGVCGFLDKILCDVKVDSRCYFPLSCLVGENNSIESIISMNPGVSLFSNFKRKTEGIFVADLLPVLPSAAAFFESINIIA